MEEIWNQITRLIGAYIPKLLGALAILIVGWLGPLAVAAIVRGGLRRTGLANRLARSVAGEEGVTGVDVERWVGRGVLSLLMLFVLVAFFQALGLTLITEPLNRLLTPDISIRPPAGRRWALAAHRLDCRQPPEAGHLASDDCLQDR